MNIRIPDRSRHCRAVQSCPPGSPGDTRTRLIAGIVAVLAAVSSPIAFSPVRPHAQAAAAAVMVTMSARGVPVVEHTIGTVVSMLPCK